MVPGGHCSATQWCRCNVYDTVHWLMAAYTTAPHPPPLPPCRPQETQTKPEGQIHFFPVIFNGKQLYDVMVERCGTSTNSLPK